MVSSGRLLALYFQGEKENIEKFSVNNNNDILIKIRHSPVLLLFLNKQFGSSTITQKFFVGKKIESFAKLFFTQN